MAYWLWAKVTDVYVIVDRLAVNSGIVVGLISADFIEGSLSGINVSGTESHGVRRGWMSEAPDDIEQMLYRRYTRHTRGAIYVDLLILHVALNYMKEERTFRLMAMRATITIYKPAVFGGCEAAEGGVD